MPEGFLLPGGERGDITPIMSVLTTTFTIKGKNLLILEQLQNKTGTEIVPDRFYYRCIFLETIHLLIPTPAGQS